MVDQLRAYFAGHLTVFNVPLAPQGTAFQKQVWSALREIPLGATTTYGALAAHVGKPSAARAVGAANGKNPISLIVPCHRVIGGSGSLTGYAGGVELKAWLLEHEATMARRTKGGLTPPALCAVSRNSMQLATEETGRYVMITGTTAPTTVQTYLQGKVDAVPSAQVSVNVTPSTSGSVNYLTITATYNFSSIFGDWVSWLASRTITTRVKVPIVT